MKKSLNIFNRLINLGIIDINLFYTTTVDIYDIKFQGKFKKRTADILKEKGFNFEYIDYIESINRTIQGIRITIVLTD